MCTAFKSKSIELCSSLAAIGKRICSVHVDPEGISAFVACRLIPIDKCPGVRPIGAGEVPRRIIVKAVLRLIADDIKEAAGPLQVCAGQESGSEAAIHATKDLFTIPDTEGVFLVDATNAFNSFNRQGALHNISILCPPLATILHNTYQAPIRLIIPENGEISSSEGTTQGDPLGMAMYAIAITPLIKTLHQSCPSSKQVWFADDATASGSCTNLRSWWDVLSLQGPDFGYYPNASKTYLVVKEEFHQTATEAFANTNVVITTEGKRHLGASIGSKSFTEEYVNSKVQVWVKEISRFSQIACSYPHEAYAAFTHGISNKWSYLSRTIPNISSLEAS